MDEREKPFQHLKQEEFLALSHEARAEYLKRVNDHAAKVLAERFPPEKKS